MYLLESFVWMRIPANTRRWHNAVLMLARRQRRRANIKTKLGQRLVFAEIRDNRAFYLPDYVE